MTEYSEQEIELGRRVGAAVISVQQGVTFQTTYNKFMKGKMPGEGWIEAGKELLRGMNEDLNTLFGRTI